MGELLLCHETIAALPYYIEETGINIYSMEELSVSFRSFLHVREFMYMGGKTDASCRTRTKTQGEYPHGRKIVRFCFCHIAGYGILYHERNAGDRFCGPADGTEVGF